MAAGFDLHVTVKMFDRTDNSHALRHVGTGAQSDCVSLFAGTERSMRLVGVAPWGTAINECFELAGNVSPVGRSDTNDRVGPFKLRQQFVEVIPQHTSGRPVAGTAAFAEVKSVIGSIINVGASE